MLLLKTIKKLIKYPYLLNKDSDEYFDESLSFNLKLFKRLLPFIARHWHKGLIASITLLIASLLSLPQPLLSKYIIDDVILKKNISVLAVIIGILVALILFEAFSSLLRQFYFFLFEQDVIFEIQHQLFDRVLRFPRSFFDSKQTGYLISRMSGDVFQLRMLFSSTLVEIFSSFLRFFGGIAILFFLHRKMALYSLIILPFFYATILFLSKKTKRLSHNLMEKSAQLSKNLYESISGVTLIKAFVREQEEVKKISNSLKESIEASIDQNTLSAVSQLIIGMIGSVGVVFVLWYGSREIIYDRLTLGSFVAFNSYLGYLYGSSRFLASTSVYMQSAFAALERVFSLFDLIPEDEGDESKIKIKKLNGKVTFENVTFAYNHQKPALQDISFTASPGIKIAIVGPTGAGKSTLVNLIMLLYRPKQGKILFDEMNAATLNLRSVRERIGIVSQEIFLFDDTILKNIQYGKPEASEEEVISVCKLAYAHEFISELPEKYCTQVGERGVKLSTGQKQRLSIARALLKNPDILIFDEPTSALDALTEKAIKEVLFERTNGKTTFIIAHRLSTVISADKIIVLEQGRIMQMGTHEKLMDQDGLYRKMCEEQFLTKSDQIKDNDSHLIL